MQQGKVALVLVLLGLSAGALAGSVDLTPANIDTQLAKSGGAFVEFFAPWCGHCKALAPDWEILADAYKNYPSVLIAKVDADAHRELGSRFGVTGFPTLKWFPQGSTTPEDYTGGRSVDEMINFVNGKAGANAKVKKAATAVVELTPSNFDSIVLDNKNAVLVEFFAPWCGHCKRLAPDYEKAAQALAGEENAFIASVNADEHRELGTKFGVSGYPTIKYFSRTNKNGEEYNGGRTPQDFVDFMNQNAGTQRSLAGGYLPEAGRIKELDELAAKFINDQASRQATLAEAKTLQASYSGHDAELAKFYVLAMQKVIEKGDDYLDGEIARLERILDGGSVGGSKKALFHKRVNILNSFA